MGVQYDAHPLLPDVLVPPIFVLLVWAAGVSLAGGLVTLKGTVGVGFTWLAVSTALVVGLWTIFATPVSWVPCVALGVAAFTVRRSRLVAGSVMLVAVPGFLISALPTGGILGTTAATLALGGITGEMLLGHWYLVDPTLPRRILRQLAMAGIVGVVADVGILLTSTLTGGFRLTAFWVVAVTTIGLMAAVLGALRHPAYSGVMAATGLSYLAVLTSVATVFFGRTVS